MERVGYRHPLTSRSSQLKSFSRQNVLCPASVSLFTEWHHFHDVGRELMKSRWGFAWPLHCLPWKLPAHTHTDTHKWSLPTYVLCLLSLHLSVGASATCWPDVCGRCTNRFIGCLPELRQPVEGETEDECWLWMSAPLSSSHQQALTGGEDIGPNIYLNFSAYVGGKDVKN